MSALFSPGRIGGLDLENRIVVSPMCQYSAVDDTTQPWHLIHIGNLMMSGAGLVMEATAVEAIGRGTHGQYVRVRPNNWLGFAYVHPDAKPPATTQQLDRPPSVAWDRPKSVRELPAKG